MVDSVERASALTRVTPTRTTTTAEVEEKFLRFQLGAEGIALLPLNAIKQVMQISVAEILPVPQMPDCVLGIINWRGEMLWLVDLGQLVGFPPLCEPEVGSGLTQESVVIQNIGLNLPWQTMMAIAIQVNDQSLGLVVQQIHDIEVHSTQQLHLPSIGLFSPEILPYLQGYLIGANKEVLMVLHAEAIAQAPLWQMHRQ